MIDIGRKSLGCCGDGIFGIGLIRLCFHCVGTEDSASDILNNFARGFAKTGAPNLRNYAGMLSSPVAVERSLSSMLNIPHSLMSFVSLWLTAAMRGGARYVGSVDVFA